MTVARSAAEVLNCHVALELECLDRRYVNAYVPLLQSGAGTSYFFHEIRGNPGAIHGADGADDALLCRLD